MANKRKWTKKKKQQFLQAVRDMANVSAACRACNMSRSQAYKEAERDEKFSADWQEAIEEAVDKLEAEAWRRAYEGFEEPVFYKGEEVGQVKKYSDRLMERLLEAHRPERYKQRYASEISGPRGGPIEQSHQMSNPVLQFFEDLKKEDGQDAGEE